jgi:Cu-Zn family superoxide dismutase
MKTSGRCVTGIFVMAAAIIASPGYSHQADSVAPHGSLPITGDRPDVTRYAAPARAPALAAKAVLMSADGKEVGTVQLTQTKAGVRLRITVEGLTPGEHGFHIHAVGKCEPPFTSAGPHFNPNEKKHGLRSREGHHAGDMRNLRVPKSGKLTTTIVNKEVTLEKGQPNSLFHDGGTALVIHAGPDDQLTDPAGNSGDRIACGVVTEEAKAASLIAPR